MSLSRLLLHIAWLKAGVAIVLAATSRMSREIHLLTVLSPLLFV
jgi:hypothetical protein